MSNKIYNTPEYKQITTPTNPSLGYKKIYPKSDGWYILNSAGTESKIVVDNYVPLNGTDVGLPVSGPIEILTSNYLHSTSGNNVARIKFLNTGIVSLEGLNTTLNKYTALNIGNGSGNSTVFSNITGFKGLQYSTDFSANYTDRSLIDKGFADLTYAPLSTSTSDFFIQNGNTFGAAAYLGTNDAFSLFFETSDIVRMSILNSGEIGIGTISPDLNSVLNISKTTNSSEYRLLINSNQNSGGSDNIGLYVTGDLSNGTDKLIVLEHTNPTFGSISGINADMLKMKLANSIEHHFNVEGFVSFGSIIDSTNSSALKVTYPNTMEMASGDVTALKIVHSKSITSGTHNKYGLLVDSTSTYSISGGTTLKNTGLRVNLSGIYNNDNINTVADFQATDLDNTTSGKTSSVLKIANYGSNYSYLKTDILFRGSNLATTQLDIAKIYAKYDGVDSEDSRFTIATLDSGGSFIDTLSVKNGKTGFGTLTPTAKIHIYDIANNGETKLLVEGYTGNSGISHDLVHIKANITNSNSVLLKLEHTNYFSNAGGSASLIKMIGGFETNQKHIFTASAYGAVFIGEDISDFSQNDIFDNGLIVSLKNDVNILGNSYSFYGAQIRNYQESDGGVSVLTKYGLKIDSTGEFLDAQGTAKNYGLYVNATNAELNYPAIFMGGNVGIGLTVPTSNLDIYDANPTSTTLSMLKLNFDGFGDNVGDEILINIGEFNSLSSIISVGGISSFKFKSIAAGNTSEFIVRNTSNDSLQLSKIQNVDPGSANEVLNLSYERYNTDTSIDAFGETVGDEAYITFGGFTKISAKLVSSGNVGIGLSTWTSGTNTEQVYISEVGEVTLNAYTGGSDRYLLVDSTGKLITGGTASGSISLKYTENLNFDSGVTVTVTHNLDTIMIQVQLWETSNNEMVSAIINNRQANSVDITFYGNTSTINVDVVIIG